MTNHCPIAARDFSAKTLRLLSREGVRLLGMCALPDERGSYLNSARGYHVDDNGCGRILDHAQVRNLGR